jgi:hypothetical protein
MTDNLDKLASGPCLIAVLSQNSCEGPKANNKKKNMGLHLYVGKTLLTHGRSPREHKFVTNFKRMEKEQ